MKTPVQIGGVVLEPFNPLAVALSLDATFVARAFAGDIMQTKEIIKAAISHKGYALVDVFQPCVVFNKQNTYQWFKEHTHYLGEDHDKEDKMKALSLALDTEKFALGIVYQRADKPTYESLVRIDAKPLHTQSVDTSTIETLFQAFL